MDGIYYEIRQGKRGRWRWAAYQDVGFGNRVNIAICNGYGYDTKELAERAAGYAAIGGWEYRKEG